MDYICSVVGNLKIDDIGLELTHMELIDLSTEDFKSSPRLRESLRNKEIVPYVQRIHPNAKRVRDRIKRNSSVEESMNLSELFSMFKAPFSSLATKIDALLTRDSNKPIEELIKKTTENNEKMDSLLKKMDTALATRTVEVVTKTSAKELQKPNIDDNIPIYVPSLETNDVSSSNIVTKQEVSEGTDDILEQLKQLKK